ncbi:MAG TPA: hypothetical protein VHL34_23660 [Rhizomicrobium sp.]|jgi:hypothetical protein|nr:hypothetical protein [Rhizomicrobium sp.]
MSDPQLPVPAPSQPEPAPLHNADARWRFIRDVAVFEFKLAVNNFHNFFQIPLTFAVAVFDLFFTAKDKAEGSRFYKLVEYGRTIDDAIDIYSIVEHRERPMNKEYTVDALVARLESVIVNEYSKGGTAANIKAAVDRAIDQMQARGGHVGDKTDDALKRAAEKMKEAMDKAKNGASGSSQ